LSWFQKGLKFECKRCGHCCSGEPGYVYLSDEEIGEISSFLGMDREEFLPMYTRRVDAGEFYEVSLRERADYSCVFLTEHGCKIQSVKPRQCSTYPFWKRILSDKALWKAEKEECPGIGCGTLHCENEIFSCLRTMENHEELRIHK